MKFRSLFFTALCGMAVSAAMVSCSDDSGYDPYELGSQVALPEHRGFVLNEGTYKNNDASISFFDAVNDTASSKECDLYFVQNKKQAKTSSPTTGTSTLLYMVPIILLSSIRQVSRKRDTLSLKTMVSLVM